jgi:hypothetical protein
MKSSKNFTIACLFLSIAVCVAVAVIAATMYLSTGFGWFTQNVETTANGARFNIIDGNTENSITSITVNGNNSAGDNNVILPNEYYYFTLKLSDSGTYQITLKVENVTYPQADDIDENMVGAEEIKAAAEADGLPACANAFKIMLLTEDKGESTCSQVWNAGKAISFTSQDEISFSATSDDVTLTGNTVYVILLFDDQVEWAEGSGNSNGFIGQSFELSFLAKSVAA